MHPPALAVRPTPTPMLAILAEAIGGKWRAHEAANVQVQTDVLPANDTGVSALSSRDRLSCSIPSPRQHVVQRCLLGEAF